MPALFGISVINDEGKWRFFRQGQGLEFEDNERYNARRIRDRFDHDLLVDYCLRLGLKVYSPDWYKDDYIIVHRDVGMGRTPLTKEALREFLRIKDSYPRR